jgi:hypothetical protein
MNAEELKRLALVKSLVEEQGADGDKRWLIAQLEAAEATCRSLLAQSSRWEAQALEAGGRIAELEALVRELRDWIEWALTLKADIRTYTAMNIRGIGLLARADKALAGAASEPQGDCAAEVAQKERAAFVMGANTLNIWRYEDAKAEALRRYPEKPREVNRE